MAIIIRNQAAILFLILSLLAMNQQSLASNQDSTSYPMNISADQLVSQTKQGVSEYKGRVILTRNKLELQGDSLKIVHPNNQVDHATAHGNPAKIKDFLPKKKQWLNGEAKEIYFDQKNDKVTLSQNATLQLDNGNQIQAEKIILFIKDETFEAIGGKQSGRVKMTIQADN